MNQLRHITSLILLLLLLGCKEHQSTEEKTPKRPNVVFILVDDLGLHDLGVTGSNFYETPNIDRIAKEGMEFTQGYAASAVCSPSRASIMTGKFTARHGITDWIGVKTGTDWRKLKRYDKLLPPDFVQNLPKEDITIAEAMKSAGYKTFFAGKWHLGSEGSYPEDHGFDINKGGWDKGGPVGGFFSPWENPKLPNMTPGESLPMRLGEETAKFIKENKEAPFFAFLSFYAVHAPIQTTEEKWKKYRDKAEKMGLAEKGYEMGRILPFRQVQDNPIYGGLVESVDDAVGTVLKTLKDNGLDENTIIIFTSDNGGVASGDAFSTTNLPLRGGKGCQWEGGIREPFFIKVPWLKQSGTQSDFPVIGTDLYPTLLELANINPLPEQHVDGLSLVPLLEGNKINLKRPLYWHYPHYGDHGGLPSSIIREGDWKLIHYWEDNHEELYQLPSTETDDENLIEKHPEIASKMSKKLMEWLAEVDAIKPEKDSEYNAELAEKRHRHIKENLLPHLEKARLEMLDSNYIPNKDWWESKTNKK